MAAKLSRLLLQPSPFPIAIPTHHHNSTCTRLKAIRGRRRRRSAAVKCATDYDDSEEIHAFSSVDLQIRSSINSNNNINSKVVFEDRVVGIVCYRDEVSGEITCEGYDEGPRFLRPSISKFGFNPIARLGPEVGIIEILERCWIQDVDNN
ncbi:uncharacterized protein LOC127240914 [Andrographis paniculata]|uniref:uncharacterized protein LOC127240914 n=1 Tax=Andrographis paniculata TaxID=175694 RepID=UPI0021E86580|nr:uncharacterized protein LOC127240914 [Andrographis paniculata]